MAIAEKEVKLLWGNAAGFCSNPDCRVKLSSIEDENSPFLMGEMAHIVARNLGGPRADLQGGADVYANLILLCPNCHTKVDKAPQKFPVETLHSWKSQHEDWVEKSLSGEKFENEKILAKEIENHLRENEYFFLKYGPRSEIAESNPEAAAFAIWLERRLDVLIPNNRKILAAIEKNQHIIGNDLSMASIAFKDHALSYEKHIYDRMEEYPLFPSEFSEIVGRLAHEREQ